MLSLKKEATSPFYRIILIVKSEAKVTDNEIAHTSISISIKIGASLGHC